jgi:hypothetical protein
VGGCIYLLYPEDILVAFKYEFNQVLKKIKSTNKPNNPFLSQTKDIQTIPFQGLKK